MRLIVGILCAGILLAGDRQHGMAQDFDPAFEGLILVNVIAPAHVETSIRMQVSGMTACVGPRRIPLQVDMEHLESFGLAGRSPRWASLRMEPAVLDSIVIDWASFEVRVDEAWTRPAATGRPTRLDLGRRVDAGEVVVLNLLWQPDALAAEAEAWHPVFEFLELVEPPLGGRVYVSEETTGIIAVHERVRGRMVRALPAGGRPRDLVWDAARQRLYATVAGRDELLIIDPSGRETIRRLPLAFGADPTRLLLTEDGRRIAVLSPARDVVFLFSASSLQEIGRVQVGQEPVAAVEDPRSGRIFVSCLRAGRIDVIDPGSARVVQRLEQLGSPSEILVLRSGLIAVGQNPGRRVEIIDPNTGARIRTLQTCGPVDGLIEVTRSDRLLALSNFCGELTVLRAESGIELGGIRIDESAGLPSLGPRGDELYLPLPGSRQILVFAAERPADRRRIDVGPGAWRVLVP